MAETWQVKLKTVAGVLEMIVDDYASFSYRRQVNSAGAFALRFARHADETQTAFEVRCALWVLDGQVEFWHRDIANSLAWTLDFEALIRWQAWYVTVDGALVYEVGGVGYVDLLARRVIYATAGSAGGTKSGPAESLMKAWVLEQVGASAGAGRVTTGLSIEADGAAGNTLTMGRSYKGVLPVLQEIAAIGGGDCDVVGTGAATFEFRWYTGQRGTDRTATVIFALERGNMAEPSLRIARQNEVNAVLVGGQGEAAARALVWRTTAGLIDDSTWNRCEQFRDARNESTTAGLNAVGDKALDEGQPRWNIGFKVVQVPTCSYGVHYFLGDLVTAKFTAYTGTKKINAVSISCNDSGTSEVIKMVEMADV